MMEGAAASSWTAATPSRRSSLVCEFLAGLSYAESFKLMQSPMDAPAIEEPERAGEDEPSSASFDTRHRHSSLCFSGAHLAR
jgi:hypothetical protein